MHADKKGRENEHHTWLTVIHNGKTFGTSVYVVESLKTLSPHILHHGSCSVTSLWSLAQKTLNFGIKKLSMPASMPGQAVVAASKPQTSSSSDKVINKCNNKLHIDAWKSFRFWILKLLLQSFLIFAVSWQKKCFPLGLFCLKCSFFKTPGFSGWDRWRSCHYRLFGSS